MTPAGTRSKQGSTSNWETFGVARFRPSPGRLVNAGFVAALCLISLVGFATSFSSWFFFAAAAIGVALGVVCAYVVRAARWPWWIALVGAVLVYFLFGGPVAVRYDLISGILPSLDTERQLAGLAISGWKQFLTSATPVDGAGPFLALPYLLGVVFSATSYSLTRHRWIGLGLIPQGILFGLVIALGTKVPWAGVPQGLAWAVVAVMWLAYRAGGRGRIATANRANAAFSRFLLGVVVVVLAGGAAWFSAAWLPGQSAQRDILRDLVQPAVDVTQYPSPMSSLRKYSSKALADTYFYNSELLQVEGADAGTLLRFAVLDSYDGWTWGAGNAGFIPVGQDIPAEPSSTAPVSLTLTIGEVYANQTPLNVWVPSLGPATTIGFLGDNARSHANSLAYSDAKSQAIVLDQLKPGDVIDVTSIPMAQAPADPSSASPLNPGPGSLVSSERTDFLAADLAKITSGAQTTWNQLVDVAESFRKGGWSDGTTWSNDGQYTPGNGQDRLKAFLATLPNYVGSDEQYAAMFALAANRIGYPARVVFGARVPEDGAVLGQDVTIWVEIATSDGWVALPPDFFIPPRDSEPQPPPPVQQQPPVILPEIAPANPKLPPQDINGIEPKAQAGLPSTTQAKPTSFLSPTTIAIAATVGGIAVVLALLLGAKAGRTWWRRRTGSSVRRIAGGWSDTLDRLRDLGVRTPPGLTRQEQARALGLPLLRALADSTDRAMFQPNAPDQAIVDAYWSQVSQAKRSLTQPKNPLTRFWIRINPHSLLPVRR